MEVIIDTAVLVFVELSVIFGIICGIIGMVTFFVYFLIRGIFVLRGAIINEKIWRVALREYVEKRNPSAKRISMFKKPILTPKDFEDRSDE